MIDQLLGLFEDEGVSLTISLQMNTNTTTNIFNND